MEHEKTTYGGSLISGGRAHGTGRGDEGYKVRRPSLIFVDNRSTINMAQNISEHDRSKHIRIRYNYIKDEIDSGEIKLEWVSTDKQMADNFTKALQGQLFVNMRNRLLSKLQ